MRGVGVAAIAVGILLSAGCAMTDGPVAVTAEPRRIPDVLYCNGVEIPSEVLTDPQPATALDPQVAEDIMGSGWFEGELADWDVVVDEPALVTLIREQTERVDPGIPGDVRDHDIASFWLGPSAMASPTPWSFLMAGDCALRIGVDGLEVAGLSVDASRPPDPADTTLHLDAWERACAGGQAAEGRLEVVEVVETETTVELVVGIRTIGGPCPGNPPTPFTVELDAPLGERVILDAATWPARELQPVDR